MLSEMVSDISLFQLDLSIMMFTTLLAANTKWRESKKFSNMCKGVFVCIMTQKTDGDIRPEDLVGNR